MKDYCIQWIEDHAIEDENGTQWLEVGGEVHLDRKFPKGSEDEFETFCWEEAMDSLH